jgi:hypothetical protein
MVHGLPTAPDYQGGEGADVKRADFSSSPVFFQAISVGHAGEFLPLGGMAARDTLRHQASPERGSDYQFSL